MKTYKVVGTYNGKVEATVKARSLLEALQKFQNAEEDSLEILDPSYFDYSEAAVKETPCP